MKKKIAVIVVAIVLCVAAAVFAVPKISFYACEPTVYFDVEYCDKVDAKMSAEDAETVKIVQAKFANHQLQTLKTVL